MCAKLLVLSGDCQGDSLAIPARKCVTFGTTATCDLLVSVTSKDAKLAVLDSDDDGWFLSVQRGHPWVVDSEIVDTDAPQKLKENSLIRLSPLGPDVRFRISSGGDVNSDEESTISFVPCLLSEPMKESAKPKSSGIATEAHKPWQDYELPDPDQWENEDEYIESPPTNWVVPFAITVVILTLGLAAFFVSKFAFFVE